MTADDRANSADLLVVVRDERHSIPVDRTFTFGRSEGCDLCLDTLDRGISRIAGAFVHEHGAWWVVNRSENRTLTVVDAVGLSAPLPVSRPGYPASRRVIDGEGIRVLVAGTVWTHQLHCTIVSPAAASDHVAESEWSATSTQTPSITDARKEVLVALVSGYLRPFPRYDPRPLTYAEIAELVGLPRSTVTKRIEAVRTQLRDHGVPGLDDDDARRPLAEWLLSMRLIVPADLEWLDGRRAAGADGAMDDPIT